MITKIKVDKFKSLENIEIDFSKITVFSGVNGEGIEDVFKLISFVPELINTETPFGLFYCCNKYSLPTETEMNVEIEMNVGSSVKVDGLTMETKLKYQNLKYEFLLKRDKSRVEFDYEKLSSGRKTFFHAKNGEKNTKIRDVKKTNFECDAIIKPILNAFRFWETPHIFAANQQFQNVEHFDNNEFVDRLGIIKHCNKLGCLVADIQKFYPSIKNIDIRYNSDIGEYNIILNGDYFRLSQIPNDMLFVLGVCTLKFITKEQEKTYILINPENNLHPKLQVELTKLLVEIDANFIVSTNSPYILTTLNNSILNNSIQAGIMGKKETLLIGENIIDNTSDILGNEFDKILDLDRKH